MLRLAINNFNKLQNFTSSLTPFSNVGKPSRSSKLKHQMIEDVIESYFSLLSKSKFKKLNDFYTSGILQTRGNKQVPNHLRALYASLQRDQVHGYEVLTQYKLPFSKLGIDQYLIYTKLNTAKGYRYMALWVGRNLNSRQSWKIYDLYLHTAAPILSIGIEDDRIIDQQFTTLCGKVIDDSILTSLFFTRFFTDRAQSKRVRKFLSTVEGCQREVIDIVQEQTEELINILNDAPTNFALNILSPQLRDRVKQFKSTILNQSQISSGQDQSRLLSISVLPSKSSQHTRILAHFYMPCTDRYLSIWFTRTLTGDMSWTINDFYIHRFSQVDHSAYVNKEYCQQTFQTVNNRTFYAADLMSKFIIIQNANA